MDSLDITLLAVLSVLWGSAYIFIREGIVFGASPLIFASVRYALSAAVFGAIAFARRDRFPSRRALALSAAIGGVFIIGLYGGFLYWGEQYTTGGYAAVLSSTAPILTIVVAYTLLPAERFGPRALLGVVLGFLGVIVLVLPDLTSGPVGAVQGPLFILLAFLSAAVGTVLLRRFARGAQNMWQIGTQFAVGGLLLGVGALLLPYPETLPATAPVWSALVALVAFSSVMGYYVYFTLHHRVGPVRANLVAYLLPLVGIAIGSGIFAEAISVWEIAGFAIVLAGVTLILSQSFRARGT